MGTFLGRLSPATSAELLARGRCRVYRAGERLLSEGDTDTHVALLIRGFVKVTGAVGGYEALLAIRVPGDIVGETAALTDRPRMATVTACGRVTAYLVAEAAFRDFLEHHSGAARQMTAVVSERLRFANRRRTEFLAYPADVRLARVLAEISAICGRQDPDGAVTIAVPLSQPEIATMVGASDVTVHKALRRLREDAVIRSGYRSVTIVDVAGLRALAYRDDPATDPPR